MRTLLITGTIAIVCRTPVARGGADGEDMPIVRSNPSLALTMPVGPGDCRVDQP